MRHSRTLFSISSNTTARIASAGLGAALLFASPFSETRTAHAASYASQVTQSSPPFEPVGPSTTFAKFETKGPQNITVLKADLSNPDLFLRAVTSKGQLGAGETMNTASRRFTDAGENVIGLINADFWKNSPRLYTPNGLFVADGYLAWAPGNRTAMIVLQDGRIVMDQFTLRITATPAGGAPVEIKDLNELSSANTTAIFTPVLREKIVGTTATHVILALDNPRFLPNEPAKARVVSTSVGQTDTITSGQVILSLPPSAAAAFTNGTVVTLDAKIPEAPGVVAQAIGGGPRLVRNGKVGIDLKRESTPRSFSTTRHPRTAIGIGGPDNKTVFMVVVDGRQPKLSVGTNLDDLGELMKNLGAREAMNLDGGGSSTMIVRGEVMNAPSDARGPRPVCNGLALISRKPAGPLARIATNTRGGTLRIPAATQAAVVLRGFDANDNPVDIPAAQLTATASSDAVKASPSFNGKLAITTAASPAKTTLSINAGNIKAVIPVEVFVPESLTISPARVDLAAGETQLLQVTANVGRERITLSPDSVTIATATPALVTVDGLKVTAGTTPGKSPLTIKVGNASATVPSSVDSFKRVLLESFDAPPRAVTGTNHLPAQSAASLAKAESPHDAATELRYAMKKSGGRSRIDVPLSATLTLAPEKLSLHIYGDGSENWIRADVLDSAGNKYLIDFTAPTKGITWKNEWRRVIYDMDKLIVMGEEAPPQPKYPVTISALSIVQDQEKLKGSGIVRYDQLEALYPPE